MTDDVEEKYDGCLVGSSSSKRQRFYIKLKPGETTIVSWKKLLRDAKQIDDVTVTSSSWPKSSSTHKTLDDNSDIGQQNKSFLRDEMLRNKIRARSSDNKPRSSPVALGRVEGKKSDGMVSNHWQEYEKLKAKALATLNKFDEHYSTPALLKDHQLGGVPGVPLLTYSKKSSIVDKQSYHPPVTSVKDASVFPEKTNNFLKLFQKNRMNVEAGNASSNFISENSPRRSVPLQTYSRSRNSVNGNQNKVRRVVQDDNLMANFNKNATPVQCLKRKVAEPSKYNAAVDHQGSPVAKSTRPLEKSIKFTLSAEKNMSKISPHAHLKKPKMEVPEKTNVKIRFHLKQEPDTTKCKEQDARNIMNHSRPAAPVKFERPN